MIPVQSVRIYHQKCGRFAGLPSVRVSVCSGSSSSPYTIGALNDLIQRTANEGTIRLMPKNLLVFTGNAVAAHWEALQDLAHFYETLQDFTVIWELDGQQVPPKTIPTGRQIALVPAFIAERPILSSGWEEVASLHKIDFCVAGGLDALHYCWREVELCRQLDLWLVGNSRFEEQTARRWGIGFNVII